TEHAAAPLSGDHVRLQAGAVGDVDDGHLFAGQQVRRFHQIFVHRHRADVVQVGPGHRGTVDLGLEHRADHAYLLAGWPSVTAVWSMSRVVPTRAATSSRAGPWVCAGPSSGSRSSR